MEEWEVREWGWSGRLCCCGRKVAFFGLLDFLSPGKTKWALALVQKQLVYIVQLGVHTIHVPFIIRTIK